MDYVMFWGTLFGAVGLAYLLFLSGACGLALFAWSVLLACQVRTRGYAIRVLKGGIVGAVVGVALAAVVVLTLPESGWYLLVWPLGPAFFGWGAVWPAALHFRYRARPWEEPV